MIVVLIVVLLSVKAIESTAFQRGVLVAASRLPIKVYPNYTVPILAPWNQSQAHNPLARTAVFAVNFPDDIFGFYNFGPFLSSLRKYHDGDVVLAVPSNSPLHYLHKLIQFDVVVYIMPLQSMENLNGVTCYYFNDMSPDKAVPLAQIRYIMYQFWALKYPKRTNILVSDFRDVFFQSNPFIYNKQSWNSPG